MNSNENQYQNEMDLKRWEEYIATLDYRPSFVTISGAHIYGFPSPDSDVDLRGCHQLGTEKVLGLSMPAETIQREEFQGSTEVDLVSHELGKYLRMLVKNNGYIMEQVFSPLVVKGHEFLERLRPLASECLTRNHYYHYRGFFATQKKLIEKQDRKKAKSLLYAYRVLLTGIHLLKTGKVETNLLSMLEHYPTRQVSELIAAKTAEKIEVDADWVFHAKQLTGLESKMEQAYYESKLPERADRRPIDRLLVEFRMDDARR